VQQLRFDGQLGIYNLSVAPEAVGILKGMGTHVLQLQVEVGIPEVEGGAGRLLSLETTLCVPRTNGPTVPLAMTNVAIAFTPGSISRPIVQYLLTNSW
jgi:hypothetical protein